MNARCPPAGRCHGASVVGHPGSENRGSRRQRRSSHPCHLLPRELRLDGPLRDLMTSSSLLRGAVICAFWHHSRVIRSPRWRRSSSRSSTSQGEEPSVFTGQFCRPRLSSPHQGPAIELGPYANNSGRRIPTPNPFVLAARFHSKNPGARFTVP